MNKKEARLSQAILSPPPPPPMTKAASLATPQAATTTAGSTSLEAVLSETTKALKVLTAQGGTAPTPIAPASQATTTSQGDPLQMIQKHLDAIRKLNKVAPVAFEETEERTALLDSGASPAYCPACSQAERDQAMRVQVKLAEGEAILHQNLGGTLLGEPTSSSSTLLPMGLLVQHQVDAKKADGSPPGSWSPEGEGQSLLSRVGRSRGSSSDSGAGGDQGKAALCSNV